MKDCIIPTPGTHRSSEIAAPLKPKHSHRPKRKVHTVRAKFANLSHATAQFTLDVYGHVTQTMRKESAERMQRFYDQLYK